MKFFEFLENLSDNGFLYYQDGNFTAVPDDDNVEEVESSDLSDIVPFVFELPYSARTARFSPRYGTYIVHKFNNNVIKSTDRLPDEDIYDFLKRER